MSDPIVVVVDLFAGAGGLSTGIANAVRSLGRVPGEDVVLVAINHNEDAIATHEANHPWAEHYHAKVEAIHPPDVAPPEQVVVLAGGPSCTHFSGARGGQPVNEQERASPWHMLRWIELLRPKHVIIENVGHLRSWGPVEDGMPSRDGTIFERYIGILQALGYTVIQDEKGRYGVKLRAANFGDPTTRERLFVLASRTKMPTAPEPSHSDDPDDGLEDWVPASEIIDWSDRGESMFTRSKALSSTTMQRIARGIRDYCDDRLQPYAGALETMEESDIYALEHEDDFEWVCFVPTADGRKGALTKYFGKVDGRDEFKFRGIECRQRSTPAWIADVQRDLIETLDEHREPAPVVDRVGRHLN